MVIRWLAAVLRVLRILRSITKGKIEMIDRKKEREAVKDQDKVIEQIRKKFNCLIRTSNRGNHIITLSTKKPSS